MPESVPRRCNFGLRLLSLAHIEKIYDRVTQIPQGPDVLDLRYDTCKLAVRLAARGLRVIGVDFSLRSMVLIAVLTGLRRGELFALRWDAVDFERKQISVRESVYDGQFNAPNTRSSVRNIPMGEAPCGQTTPLRAIWCSSASRGRHYGPRTFSSGNSSSLRAGRAAEGGLA